MSFPDLPYWPEGVRMSVLRDNYGVEKPEEYLRSPMERGAKQRRVSTGLPDRLACRFRFPYNEYELFTYFFDVTLPETGDLRFYWRHPETSKPALGRPYVQDGRIYTPSPAPGHNRFVDMTIDTVTLPSHFIYGGNNS